MSQEVVALEYRVRHILADLVGPQPLRLQQPLCLCASPPLLSFSPGLEESYISTSFFKLQRKQKELAWPLPACPKSSIP